MPGGDGNQGDKPKKDGNGFTAPVDDTIPADNNDDAPQEDGGDGGQGDKPGLGGG